MTELLFEIISVVKKPEDAPKVPLAPGIDYEALVALDTKAGDDPVFVTLPIGEVNIVSGNGRKYPVEAIESLVEAINSEKPGGIQGHLRDEDRAYEFELPSLIWVGAVIVEGIAWGKAYIPRYASAVREYVSNCQAIKAKIATSIYGLAEMAGNIVKRLFIESIDLAHPARAGVKTAVAVPLVTTEMVDEKNLHLEKDLQNMPEGTTPVAPDNGNLISELTTAKTTALARVDELESKLTELTKSAETLKLASAKLAESAYSYTNASISVSASGENIVEVIEQLLDSLNQMQKRNVTDELDRAVEEMVKLPANTDQGKALRSVVKMMLGESKTVEEGKTRLVEIANNPTYLALAKASVVEASGGNVIVTGEQKEEDPDKKRRDALVANSKEIAKKYGS